MTLKQHAVGSALAGAGFFALTQSWEGTLVCFLSGIFIDLDHVLDYCVIKKKMCNYRELVDFCFDQSGQVFLFLHSFEMLAVLWVLFFLYGMPVILGGLGLGLSVHLILDQIGNPVSPLAYFIFYRWKLGFPKTIFFKNITPEILKRNYDEHFR